jgi:hypothetical protein
MAVVTAGGQALSAIKLDEPCCTTALGSTDRARCARRTCDRSREVSSAAAVYEMVKVSGIMHQHVGINTQVG